MNYGENYGDRITVTATVTIGVRGAGNFGDCGWRHTERFAYRSRRILAGTSARSGLRGRGTIKRRGLVMSKTCFQHDGPVGGFAASAADSLRWVVTVTELWRLFLPT